MILGLGYVIRSKFENCHTSTLCCEYGPAADKLCRSSSAEVVKMDEEGDAAIGTAVERVCASSAEAGGGTDGWMDPFA